MGRRYGSDAGFSPGGADRPRDRSKQRSSASAGEPRPFLQTGGNVPGGVVAIGALALYLDFINLFLLLLRARSRG
jgi:hypothetical protein